MRSSREGPHPWTPRVLVFVSLALALAAIFAAYGNITRTIETPHTIDVRAPASFEWTLWLPRAEEAVALSVSGFARAEDSVDTPSGMMENVTGRGNATFTWTFRRTVYGTGLPSPGMFGSVKLSGQEGLSFRVWRSTADPSIPMKVFAGWPYTASHLGGKIYCGGSGFSGTVAEGWNALPRPIGGTDCSALIDSVPCLEVVMPALILCSGGAAVAAFFTKRRLSARG